MLFFFGCCILVKFFFTPAMDKSIWTSIETPYRFKQSFAQWRGHPSMTMILLPDCAVLTNDRTPPLQHLRCRTFRRVALCQDGSRENWPVGLHLSTRSRNRPEANCSIRLFGASLPLLVLWSYLKWPVISDSSAGTFTWLKSRLKRVQIIHIWWCFGKTIELLDNLLL